MEIYNTKVKLKYVFLCVLMLMAILSSVKALSPILNHSGDFQYDSAKLFALRIDPYDETLNPSGVAKELGLTKYYGNVEANQFPSFIILLTPFTLLEPKAANVVWAIFNLIFTAIIVILMKKLFFSRIDRYAYACLICIMLSGIAWRTNISVGQHTVFAFAFFLVSLWLSEGKHPILSGAALAISLFKYTLILPLMVYLIYKKRFKEIFIAAGIHIALTLFACWWLGESVINIIVKPLQVSSLLSDQGYIDIGSLFDFSSKTNIVLAIIICIAVFIMSLLRTNKEDHHLLLYSILSYVSLIAIYHRTYDFFILIVPVGIMYSMYKKDKKWKFPMSISLLIFVYSNYIEKILSMLSWLPDNVVQLLTVCFAIFVYAYIIYLSVIYIQEYKQRAE